MNNDENALFDRFVDLANECFAEYSGELEEKISTWCFEIQPLHERESNYEDLRVSARNRAIECV